MKRYITITLLLLSTVATAVAQTTSKSSYFLERSSMSHKLNPSFSSEYGYVSFPMLGNISLSTQSNLALENFFFPLDNGQLGTFLHQDVTSEQFLSGLKDNNFLNQSLNLTILSSGFHAFGGFNTIDLSFKQNSIFNMDKSMFEMLKVGQQDDTMYEIEDTRFTLNSYAELAFGHSRRINEDITIGGKLKFLVGAAYADVTIDKMNVTMSEDLWSADIEGSGSVAALGSTIDDLDNIQPAGIGGVGVAVDLGITYENLVENLTLSAAITDLGYIGYSKASSLTINAQSEFSGFNDLDIDDLDGSTDSTLDELKDDFSSVTDPEFVPTNKSAITMLSATLNFGAEYQVVDEKFSVGLLSSTTFSSYILTDLMLSANYSPARWFNMALTGTVSNYGTYWGWILNVCPSKGLNLFVGADHMISSITPQFIPIKNATMNLNFGLNIPIGKSHRY